MIAQTYRRLTGTPWKTTRSLTAEHGPTLATRYPELAGYSVTELLSRPIHEVLAEIEAGRSTCSDELVEATR